MATEWHFKAGGAEFGPASPSELARMAAEGRIAPETLVRKGDGAWVPASRVSGLFDRTSRATFPEAAPPRTPPPGEPLEVLDSAEADGFKVEILAHRKLGGSKDAETASAVFFANQAGIQLKQIRLTLNDGEAIAESGALQFMHGRVEMDAGIGGLAGLGKAMMNKFVAREAAIMPRYRGTGRIYLEPSFSHFLIHRLVGEEVIADKGLFCCGQGTLDVGAAPQRNVSSALFGGEGWFQTRVRGTGICVFESPVPADEVVRVDLKDETLRVDGNFALMRTGRIEFSAEKSARSLLGTLVGGEGLLQTFRGTGSVWLAPTRHVYQSLQASGLAALQAASRSSNTAT